MKKLLEFLSKLEENNIYYRLNKVRDSIMVEVAVPGERWEVEFFENGEIEIEKFVSAGMFGEQELDVLFSEFRD